MATRIGFTGVAPESTFRNHHEDQRPAHRHRPLLHLGGALVLGANLASPLYSAVIAWDPASSAAVEKNAMPLTSIETVPSATASALNVTVPVGTPTAFGVAFVTPEVKVTDCPTSDGFSDETIAVVVDALFTV